MDDQAKRWFFFMIVALLLVNLLYIHPRVKEAEEERARAKKTSVTRDETRPPSETELAREDPTYQPTLPQRLVPPQRIEEPEEPPQEITVETDVSRITFTTRGAYPVRWQIIDPVFAIASQTDVESSAQKSGGRSRLKVGDPLPIEIIPDYPGIGPDRDYPLMVVLKETGGRFFEEFNRRNYTFEQPYPDGMGVTLLNFKHETPEGLRLEKTYRFQKNSYLTQLQMRLTNVAREGAQNLDFSESGLPGIGLFWGPGIGEAYYTDRWDKSLYTTAAFDGHKIASKSFGNWEKVATGARIEAVFEGDYRWGLLDSRFFMAAIIPERGTPLVHGLVKRQHVPSQESLRNNMAPPITTEVFSGPFGLHPGVTRTFDYELYVGPKKRKILAEIDNEKHYGLREIMFHQSMWLIRVLAVFMLWLLNYLYDATHSYGVSIILLTMIMRLITQPFTHIGMKSQARVMAEQQRVKPLIDAINEKYKDDPQKRNAEVWKTYREHGVNPLGAMKGCIWMLIQLPIFLALYRLLQYAIDLRGQGFLWIADLTAPDALFLLPFHIPFLGNKFNLLPILMGVSQLFAQRLAMSNIQDPNQKMMATLMPVMFIFILYNFAAGLSLYWFVSNLWQIVFQVFVNKRVKEEAERKAHLAFEERKKAAEKAPPFPQKAAATRASWQDRLMAHLEKRAKGAKDAQQGKKEK